MISAVSSLRRRPAAAASALFAVTLGATLIAAALLRLVAPDLEPLTQRLIAVLALAVLAVVVTAAARPTVFRGGQIWTPLLVLPALVVLAPFAAGLKDAGLQAVLVVPAGYLATGVYEELWFRGLVLESLRSWKPLHAALLSSLLFGLAHLSNIAFGADPLITAAQVVGAFCFGVGFAALRLRGVSIWVLVILHAVADIALQLGNVGSAWRWGLMIGGDTILLVYGLILLRKAAAARIAASDPGGTAHRSAGRNAPAASPAAEGR